MDNIQQLKIIPIAIFIGSIYFTLQSFYAINKLEDFHNKEKHNVECEVLEVIPCILEKDRIYKLKTGENDSFFILKHKVKSFEKNGISNKLRRYQKSIIQYSIDKKSKLRSVERITIKGKSYLNNDSVFYDSNKKLKDYYKNLYISIASLIVSSIVSFFIIKNWNNESNLVRNLKLNQHLLINDYKFPITKGDLRISKIKDYFVIDSKITFELHELIKIKPDSIIKNGLIGNKVIKTVNKEYLYLKTYRSSRGNGQNSDHRIDYVSEYYLKAKDSKKLILLFNHKEENIKENGMADYFIQTNTETVQILSAILKINYKLLEKIK